MVVKEGDRVLAGDPLFVDKNRPQVSFCSPVSGTVEAVVRGEKRKLLAVTVKADGKMEYRRKKAAVPASMTKEKAAERMLQMGLWPMVIQRPYGIIANPDDSPKSIFISAMDTAPLAPDYDFVLQNRFDDVQTGIDVLGKFTKGGVHFSMNY
jgi:Na+-transporting NADH:ubiquinone oxidoreductase subunit A